MNTVIYDNDSNTNDRNNNGDVDNNAINITKILLLLIIILKIITINIGMNIFVHNILGSPVNYVQSKLISSEYFAMVSNIKMQE